MTGTWRRKTAGVTVVAVLAGIALLPMAAMADSFFVDLPKRIVFDDPGTTHLLSTAPVPEDLVGLSCAVDADGNNNESVHEDNNIEVSSVNTVTLVDVEEYSDKDTVADGMITLGDTVTFTLILGPDGVYSANYRVTFQCQPAETTTTSTTTPETTTTAPETTTTTVPVTTPTTAPETTTTTAPPEATTTTAPPETTTTTAPPVVGPTTTTPATSDTLPFTGVDSDQLAVVALLALGAGSGLVALTGRNKEDQPEVL